MMPLHIFANGEQLTAAQQNALQLQSIISVADETERDGYDFGDEPVTIYRRDKHWCERYYPSIELDPRGAYLPGWYPVDNKPYVDLFTQPLEFPTGVTSIIGSGLTDPYPYWWRNWDSEDWGGTNDGPLVAGPLRPNLQGIYRVTYRVSWNRQSTNGKRYGSIYLNDKEIPGARVTVAADVDNAGHGVTVVEIPLNGVDDEINFSMAQDSGITITGRAFATVEWVRPVQYEQEGWE